MAAVHLGHMLWAQKKKKNVLKNMECTIQVSTVMNVQNVFWGCDTLQFCI